MITGNFSIRKDKINIKGSGWIFSENHESFDLYITDGYNKIKKIDLLPSLYIYTYFDKKYDKSLFQFDLFYKFV